MLPNWILRRKEQSAASRGRNSRQQGHSGGRNHGAKRRLRFEEAEGRLLLSVSPVLVNPPNLPAAAATGTAFSLTAPYPSAARARFPMRQRPLPQRQAQTGPGTQWRRILRHPLPAQSHLSAVRGRCLLLPLPEMPTPQSGWVSTGIAHPRWNRSGRNRTFPVARRRTTHGTRCFRTTR